MRFTRDLQESKVIRSREQFRKFIYYNNDAGCVPSPQKNSIYAFIPYSRLFIRRTSVPCPIALGRARSSGEAVPHSECEKYVLRGMESRGNVKGRRYRGEFC